MIQNLLGKQQLLQTVPGLHTTPAPLLWRPQ
jgi:hypothetical protein